MKKLLTLIVSGFFLLVPFVHAEEIISFDSDLLVKTDGHVVVTETIDYDFGAEQKHGIFRILKTAHPQGASSWSKDRFIAYTVLSVEADSVNVPFTVTDSRNSIEVKIGDADHTISGNHQYVIVYDMAGALSYGRSGAELYYNATGHDWPVQIDLATVVVRDPTGTLLGKKTSCYKGALNATTDCTFTVASTSVTFTATNISSGEGLTIAQELQAANIAVLNTEKPNFQLFLLWGSIIWLIGLSIWAIRYHQAFKTRQPIIAQYEPSAGLHPMYTGVIFDNKLDAKDITAGIIYLAEQGFLKIKRTNEKILWLFNSTDYEFTLLRPIDEMPTPSLQTLLQLFFLGVGVGTVIKLSDLKKNQIENAKTRTMLANALENDLSTDGYLISFSAQLGNTLTILVIIGIIGGFIVMIMHNIIATVVIVMSLGIVILAGYHRRTRKGYEALNYLKGFKLFLSVTETERYKFFNAPEKSPEQFMQYLPYAIAFGVENEWAKAFVGITLPNPEWYDGGSISTFSAMALTSDLGAFSTTFAASSGTSGSSGGGFSGGGGGGGGGGSW